MTSDIQLPLYQSHKQVRAAKITKVNHNEGILNSLTVQIGSHSATIPVSEEWLERHNPKPNGYYVLYKDGYESWSPEEAFEEGYTLA